MRNLDQEYSFELFQSENFSAEIVVRCSERSHEPRLTNLREIMGNIVIVANIQPAESGKTGYFTKFFLERENHEVTVISRYNPHLDEYLQSSLHIALQIVEKASLNAWHKFFPCDDDDHDEIFPHLSMAIKQVKRIERYVKFLTQNLDAVDAELESQGGNYRLATAPFNYLNQEDFDERLWPEEEFSAADIGFVRKSKQVYMLVGLITELTIDAQNDLACFKLRVAGSYCLTIDFKVSMTAFGDYDFTTKFGVLPGKIIILENLDLLSSNRVSLRQGRSYRLIEFRILDLTIADYKNIQKGDVKAVEYDVNLSFFGGKVVKPGTWPPSVDKDGLQFVKSLSHRAKQMLQEHNLKEVMGSDWQFEKEIDHEDLVEPCSSQQPKAERKKIDACRRLNFFKDECEDGGEDSNGKTENLAEPCSSKQPEPKRSKKNDDCRRLSFIEDECEVDGEDSNEVNCQINITAEDIAFIDDLISDESWEQYLNF